MNQKDRINRTLVSVTFFALLVPLYLSALFMPGYGTIDMLRILIQRNEFMNPGGVYVLVFSALCLFSVVLVLARHRVGKGAAILLVSMVVQSMATGWMTEETSVRSVQIGRSNSIVGMNVVCNGVSLGTTPLTITEKEFRSSVSPWNEPPQQKKILWSDNRDKYAWSRFYYSPCDLFDYPMMGNESLNTRITLMGNSDEKALEYFGDSKYWWHFELDGCEGYGRATNYISSGMHVFHLSPDITFPSLNPHLSMVMKALRDNDSVPSEEWIAHFRAHKNSLFLPYFAKARRDDRLMPALRVAAMQEFGLPQHFTEADCERVLDEVMRRTNKVGGFTSPSLETTILDIMGEKASKALCTRYASLPIRARTFHGGTSSYIEQGTLVTTTYSNDKHAARFALEYLIRRITPPELFNRLVYEFGLDQKGLSLIGNYGTDKSRQIVNERLSRVSSSAGRDYGSYQLVSEALMIHDPELNEIVVRTVGKLCQQEGNEMMISSLIASSERTPEISDTIVAHISFMNFLHDGRQVSLLTQLNSVHAVIRTMGLANKNSNIREIAIYALQQNPNPSFDQFLIESHRYYLSPNGPGHRFSNLDSAMVLHDTEKMREYLTELWQTDKVSWLETIASSEKGHLALGWWVPLIRELREPELQIQGIAALTAIDTPEAWQTIEFWLNSSADEVCSRAQSAIETARAERLRALSVIRGETKPDDLLESSAPYTWNGREYVQS